MDFHREIKLTNRTSSVKLLLCSRELPSVSRRKGQCPPVGLKVQVFTHSWKRRVTLVEGSLVKRLYLYVI